MKPRRWFMTPDLSAWRYRRALGELYAPFFWFPRAPLDWINLMEENRWKS